MKTTLLFLIVLILLLDVCLSKRHNEKMLMVVPEKSASTIEDMMAPIMMGILLKLLAMIPMVLVKIGFFAITSLLGSIISLVVSVGGMLKNALFPDKKQMSQDMMMMMPPPNMMDMTMKPYHMQPEPEIMHKSPFSDPSPFKTKFQKFVDTKRDLINNLFGNDEDDQKTSSSNHIYRIHNGHHEGQHSRSND